MPDVGLALIFSPSEPGAYAAEVRFNPGDMALDDIKFYVALGQGLLYLAGQQTDDVLKVGAQIVMANYEAANPEPEVVPVEPSDIPQELAELPLDNVLEFKAKKKSK